MFVLLTPFVSTASQPGKIPIPYLADTGLVGLYCEYPGMIKTSFTPSHQLFQ